MQRSAARRLIAPVRGTRPAGGAAARILAVLAALMLPACSTLGLEDRPFADAPGAEALRVASLETEVEKLKAEKAQLEKRLADIQRQAARDTAQPQQQATAEIPAPPSDVAEAIEPLQAPPLKADTVVATARAGAALKDAPAKPVDPSPRLVQPSFASEEETIFENEASGLIKTSSVLYGVHLASYRAEEEARTGWRKLQRENPDELGLLEPRIEAVSIEGRGAFLRLIGGGFSALEKAEALCGRLQVKSVYCSVTSFKGEPLSVAQLR